jgi:hypothetical protein
MGVVPQKHKTKVMNHRKIIQFGSAIFLIESILMGIWFYSMKPHSSNAFGLLQIVFLLLGINLISGLVLYFLKKPFASLFLANSIICPMIFYALWIMCFTYWAK